MSNASPIDWEQAMTDTEANARTAARLSERTVGGVAKVIETQDRHSRRLDEIAKTVRQISARAEEAPPPPRHHPRQPIPQPHRPLPWRALALAFAVGAACGASFASW